MLLAEIIGCLNSKVIPFTLAILGFGLLIAAHEFGHFIFCKIFGIHTPTFSIGFGPELIRKKIGQTDFRLAIIPFGGYVEIAGMAEIGQGEQEYADITGPRSFADKPFWQKALVLMGGIIMNFLFAYIVFCGLFMVGSKTEVQGVIVTAFAKESAAEKAGIRVGDGILKVNSIDLTDQQQQTIGNAQHKLLQEIRSNPGKKLIFTISREKQTLDIPVVLGSRKEGETEIGALGAGLGTPIARLPFFKAIQAGIATTNQWIVTILGGIYGLLSRRSLEGAGGPITIISQSFLSAQYGLFSLMTFLALFSINLGIINAFPFGMLDGGQLLFTAIEAIIRRRIPETIKTTINLASLVILVGLMLYLTVKDIDVMIGNKLSFLKDKIASLWHK